MKDNLEQALGTNLNSYLVVRFSTKNYDSADECPLTGFALMRQDEWDNYKLLVSQVEFPFTWYYWGMNEITFLDPASFWKYFETEDVDLFVSEAIKATVYERFDDEAFGIFPSLSQINEVLNDQSYRNSA